MVSDVELNEGYLKTGVTVVNEESSTLEGTSTRGSIIKSTSNVEYDSWTGREINDSLQEADVLRKLLIKSFSNRTKCLHTVQVTLAECIDFTAIAKCLVGNRNDHCPYNEVDLAMKGQEEFKSLYNYLAECPHVVETSLNFHPVLASRTHDKIKQAVASTIWGANLDTIGLPMLKIVDGPNKNKTLFEIESIINHPNLMVDSFSKEQISESFTLDPVFKITFVGLEAVFNVKIVKSVLWESLYNTPSFFNIIGKEGCFILDFAYNIGGSEAIAETYFGIMKSQMKDNHNPETTDLRTIIKMTLPEPSCCPEAIKEISKLYINGDKKNIKKHRNNVLLERAARKYKTSKAIDNFRFKESAGCSYIK